MNGCVNIKQTQNVPALISNVLSGVINYKEEHNQQTLIINLFTLKQETHS